MLWEYALLKKKLWRDLDHCNKLKYAELNKEKYWKNNLIVAAAPIKKPDKCSGKRARICSSNDMPVPPKPWAHQQPLDKSSSFNSTKLRNVRKPSKSATSFSRTVPQRSNSTSGLSAGQRKHKLWQIDRLLFVLLHTFFSTYCAL